MLTLKLSGILWLILLIVTNISIHDASFKSCEIAHNSHDFDLFYEKIITSRPF